MSESQNIVIRTITKVVSYYRLSFHYYFMVMLYKLTGRFKKEQPKPCKHVLSKEKFRNPTYPPDLSELFPENRKEFHTDTCLWQKLEPEDK